MVEHLERAINSLRALPHEKQAAVVDLLLDIADAAREASYVLSPEEARLVDEGLKELDEGRYATEKQVDEVFAKYRK